MALVTFTDEKEQESTGKFSEESGPTLRQPSHDFSMLKMYLLGNTIEEIASSYFKGRAKIDSEITKSLRLLKKKLYPSIPDQVVLNPLPYRKFWLNLIEDYQILEVTEDPANIETYYYNLFINLSREEQMAMVDELRKHL